MNVRANQLEALFDSAAAVGPRHWKGRLSRNNLESWLQGIISDVRNGKHKAPEETALYRMSWYRDTNGELLDTQVTAVEVLNILRPIVATAVYIVFTALALFENPIAKKKLLHAKKGYYEMFVQEVRRYYPFFPFQAARVRKDFLWKGHDFKKTIWYYWICMEQTIILIYGIIPISLYLSDLQIEKKIHTISSLKAVEAIIMVIGALGSG